MGKGNSVDEILEPTDCALRRLNPDLTLPLTIVSPQIFSALNFTSLLSVTQWSSSSSSSSPSPLALRPSPYALRPSQSHKGFFLPSSLSKSCIFIYIFLIVNRLSDPLSKPLLRFGLLVCFVSVIYIFLEIYFSEQFLLCWINNLVEFCMIPVIFAIIPSRSGSLFSFICWNLPVTS